MSDPMSSHEQLKFKEGMHLRKERKKPEENSMNPINWKRKK